ncbi:MAG: FAD-dependent 5-carboxymethylaminomethyl-2-thiouridine(34) oxidoreductase MnmC [Pseudomonadota bacterium]
MLLAGCGLPGAWAGRAQWRILDTGFGPGLNFLAAWRAWKDDPRRPRMLHYAAIAAQPVGPGDLLRGTAAFPELHSLAGELAAQWWGLLPGFHRLSFDGGRVLLTLCVGEAAAMLRELRCGADSVFLDAAWEPATAKAVVRLCRRCTGIAAPSMTDGARGELVQCGFRLRSEGAGLSGTYAPAWEPKVRGDAIEPVPAGRCAVIGGGLAGAAVAASLARRGWQVQVLDAHPAPAQGTSSLPAGLMAPHQSPDDNLLSRLTRAGARITLAQCEDLLVPGQDWQRSGALEHRLGDPRCAPDLGDGGAAWTCTADAARKADAGLAETDQAWWHAAAAWIKPAALVNAWLVQPGITWRGGVTVQAVARDADGWRVVDAQGADCARADLVVVAAALGSAALLDQRLALNPVRGQVSWGWHDDASQLPPWPVNGHGHLLPAFPLDGGMAWLSGSTYGRGDTATDTRPADQQANLERLRQLAPCAAASLEAQFARGTVQAWAGVRCTARDRRPLAGLLAPGLAVSTAMGSRGLTFAALCAELIAARLHGEPPPLPGRLADALDAGRQLPG